MTTRVQTSLVAGEDSLNGALRFDIGSYLDSNPDLRSELQKYARHFYAATLGMWGTSEKAVQGCLAGVHLFIRANVEALRENGVLAGISDQFVFNDLKAAFENEVENLLSAEEKELYVQQAQSTVINIMDAEMGILSVADSAMAKSIYQTGMVGDLGFSDWNMRAYGMVNGLLDWSDDPIDKALLTAAGIAVCWACPPMIFVIGGIGLMFGSVEMGVGEAALDQAESYQDRYQAAELSGSGLGTVIVSTGAVALGAARFGAKAPTNLTNSGASTTTGTGTASTVTPPVAVEPVVKVAPKSFTRPPNLTQYGLLAAEETARNSGQGGGPTAAPSSITAAGEGSTSGGLQTTATNATPRVIPRVGSEPLALPRTTPAPIGAGANEMGAGPALSLAEIAELINQAAVSMPRAMPAVIEVVPTTMPINPAVVALVGGAAAPAVPLPAPAPSYERDEGGPKILPGRDVDLVMDMPAAVKELLMDFPALWSEVMEAPGAEEAGDQPIGDRPVVTSEDYRREIQKDPEIASLAVTIKELRAQGNFTEANRLAKEFEIRVMAAFARANHDHGMQVARIPVSGNVGLNYGVPEFLQNHYIDTMRVLAKELTKHLIDQLDLGSLASVGGRLDPEPLIAGLTADPLGNDLVEFDIYVMDYSALSDAEFQALLENVMLLLMSSASLNFGELHLNINAKDLIQEVRNRAMNTRDFEMVDYWMKLSQLILNAIAEIQKQKYGALIMPNSSPDHVRYTSVALSEVNISLGGASGLSLPFSLPTARCEDLATLVEVALPMLTQKAGLQIDSRVLIQALRSGQPVTTVSTRRLNFSNLSVAEMRTLLDVSLLFLMLPNVGQQAGIEPVPIKFGFHFDDVLLAATLFMARLSEQGRASEADLIQRSLGRLQAALGMARNQHLIEEADILSYPVRMPLSEDARKLLDGSLVSMKHGKWLHLLDDRILAVIENQGYSVNDVITIEEMFFDYQGRQERILGIVFNDSRDSSRGLIFYGPLLNQDPEFKRIATPRLRAFMVKNEFDPEQSVFKNGEESKTATIRLPFGASSGATIDFALAADESGYNDFLVRVRAQAAVMSNVLDRPISVDAVVATIESATAATTFNRGLFDQEPMPSSIRDFAQLTDADLVALMDLVTLLLGAASDSLNLAIHIPTLIFEAETRIDSLEVEYGEGASLQRAPTLVQSLEVLKSVYERISSEAGDGLELTQSEPSIEILLTEDHHQYGHVGGVSWFQSQLQGVRYAGVVDVSIPGARGVDIGIGIAPENRPAFLAAYDEVARAFQANSVSFNPRTLLPVFDANAQTTTPNINVGRDYTALSNEALLWLIDAMTLLIRTSQQSQIQVALTWSVEAVIVEARLRAMRGDDRFRVATDTLTDAYSANFLNSGGSSKIVEREQGVWSRRLLGSDRFTLPDSGGRGGISFGARRWMRELSQGQMALLALDGVDLNEVVAVTTLMVLDSTVGNGEILVVEYAGVDLQTTHSTLFFYHPEWRSAFDMYNFSPLMVESDQPLKIVIDLDGGGVDIVKPGKRAYQNAQTRVAIANSGGQSYSFDMSGLSADQMQLELRQISSEFPAREGEPDPFDGMIKALSQPANPVSVHGGNLTDFTKLSNEELGVLIAQLSLLCRLARGIGAPLQLSLNIDAVILEARIRILNMPQGEQSQRLDRRLGVLAAAYTSLVSQHIEFNGQRMPVLQQPSLEDSSMVYSWPEWARGGETDVQGLGYTPWQNQVPSYILAELIAGKLPPQDVIKIWQVQVVDPVTGPETAYVVLYRYRDKQGNLDPDHSFDYWTISPVYFRRDPEATKRLRSLLKVEIARLQREDPTAR